MPVPTRVCLEVGKTWVFAAALDWPGWCRRGKGEEAALDALVDYAPRYADVAGAGFAVGDIHVVGRVSGNATTDFGAPGLPGDWDGSLAGKDLKHHLRLMEATWAYFDEVVRTAPASLRKGPRGGGRDRDAVGDHVREAERSYGRKVGVRVPLRTPWAEQRAALATGLQDVTEPAWPVSYLIRRVAWHVLDHAWEIQDRSTSSH